MPAGRQARCCIRVLQFPHREVAMCPLLAYILYGIILFVMRQSVTLSTILEKRQVSMKLNAVVHVPISVWDVMASIYAV